LSRKALLLVNVGRTFATAAFLTLKNVARAVKYSRNTDARSRGPLTILSAVCIMEQAFVKLFIRFLFLSV